MELQERFERLQKALEGLAEDSLRAPILVEGPRDEAALRLLGIEGEILVFNRIGSILDVADKLRGRGRVILLLDWDRKGGHLVELVRRQLMGQVEMDLAWRKEFAVVSQVRCVEDLPHALDNVRKRVGRARDELHRF